MANKFVPPSDSDSASEVIFGQIEQDLEAGELRELWGNLRSELSEGGIDAVRTYLDAERERRKAIVLQSIEDLRNQLEEIE